MRRNDRLYERIREIHEREQTVVLTLVHGGQTVALHFENGTISAVNSNNPQFRLGRYLKEAGILDDAGIHQLIKEARRQRMFIGQAAVKNGLIDIETLLELIQEQAVQILMHVFQDKYEIRTVGQELLQYYVPARIDLQHLMLLIARKSAEPFSLNLSRLIVLKENTELSNLPWFPEELAVMGLLKHPRRAHELQTMAGLDETRLSRILSVFDSLRLIELVDAPTETTTAIVKRHGFPFDSLVPQIPAGNVSWQLECLLNANSFVSEQFRSLKVRIAGMSQERPSKVITVTSPDNQAGKSLLSANLAVSFANDPERKTILIDCDFRKPSLHSLVGASIEPGLVGYLEDHRLQSFCYMRRLENLFIMTAGGKSPNSVELLSLEKMRNFIQYLRTEFDTIILDAPPLVPISDAQILSGLSDGVMLVIRSGQTSYTSIERGMRGVDLSKLIGVVLNDVPPLMFNTQYDPSYYGTAQAGQYTYGVGQKKTGRHLRNYLD